MKNVLLILTATLFISACYTRRSEPFRGKLERYSTRVQHGEQLFYQHCDKCHPSGEYGLGLALNPVPVPRFVKAFQIRTGLGVMPSFKKDELSRSEVRDITLYMKALKHNKVDHSKSTSVVKH